MHSADTTTLRLVALVSMLLLAGGATGPAVTAKAPPEPVCGVCTAQLDAAAETHGVSLDRGETSMQIQLTPNGTATFVAQVTLRNGSTQLQNESLRTALSGMSPTASSVIGEISEQPSWTTSYGCGTRRAASLTEPSESCSSTRFTPVAPRRWPAVARAAHTRVLTG